jgi:CDP-diacylglycerol--serine O-phosphatidyltransferase
MFLRLIKRHDVPVTVLIPNLITTVALCCGLASLHFALAQNWEKAMAAIVLSAIFDALDGRAARMLRVTSRFGAVLDSLSDFLAFGVAPALILHQWLLKPVDGFGLAAVVTFPLCAALRLARFTSDPPTPKPSPSAGNYFIGLPTPAAAGLVMVPAMLASARRSWEAPDWVVIAFTLLIAMLMISRIPMFSLKRLRINRRLVAPLLVLVGLTVVMFVKDSWLTMSVICLAYLATLPLSMYLRSRSRRAEQAAAVHAPSEPHDRPVSMHQ